MDDIEIREPLRTWLAAYGGTTDEHR